MKNKRPVLIEIAIHDELKIRAIKAGRKLGVYVNELLKKLLK